MTNQEMTQSSPARKRSRLSLKNKDVKSSAVNNLHTALNKSDSRCDSPKEASTAPVISSGSGKHADCDYSSKELSGAAKKLTPGVAALHNLGNTCYLNSILQVLRYTPGFVDKINILAREVRISQKERSLIAELQNDDDSEEEEILTWKMVRTLQNLFKKMNRAEERFSKRESVFIAIRPFDLMETLEQLNPMFEGNQQHDAHELLRCILAYMQDAAKEVNKYRRQTRLQAANHSVQVAKDIVSDPRVTQNSSQANVQVESFKSETMTSFGRQSAGVECDAIETNANLSLLPTTSGSQLNELAETSNPLMSSSIPSTSLISADVDMTSSSAVSHHDSGDLPIKTEGIAKHHDMAPNMTSLAQACYKCDLLNLNASRKQRVISKSRSFSGTTHEYGTELKMCDQCLFLGKGCDTPHMANKSGQPNGDVGIRKNLTLRSSSADSLNYSSANRDIFVPSKVNKCAINKASRSQTKAENNLLEALDHNEDQVSRNANVATMVKTTDKRCDGPDGDTSKMRGCSRSTNSNSCSANGPENAEGCVNSSTRSFCPNLGAGKDLVTKLKSIKFDKCFRVKEHLEDHHKPLVCKVKDEPSSMGSQNQGSIVVNARAIFPTEKVLKHSPPECEMDVDSLSDGQKKSRGRKKSVINDVKVQGHSYSNDEPSLRRSQRSRSWNKPTVSSAPKSKKTNQKSLGLAKTVSKTDSDCENQKENDSVGQENDSGSDRGKDCLSNGCSGQGRNVPAVNRVKDIKPIMETMSGLLKTSTVRRYGTTSVVVGQSPSPPSSVNTKSSPSKLHHVSPTASRVFSRSFVEVVDDEVAFKFKSPLSQLFLEEMRGDDAEEIVAGGFLSNGTAEHVFTDGISREAQLDGTSETATPITQTTNVSQAGNSVVDQFHLFTNSAPMNNLQSTPKHAQVTGQVKPFDGFRKRQTARKTLGGASRQLCLNSLYNGSPRQSGADVGNSFQSRDSKIAAQLEAERLKTDAMDRAKKAVVKLEKYDMKSYKQSVQQQPKPNSLAEIKRTMHHVRDCIEGVFQGVMALRTRCLECERFTERREDYQDIHVPVRKERNKVDDEDDDEEDSGDSVSWIMKSLDEVERLKDDNKYRCERCMRLVEAERYMHYVSVPQVLTIHLKRFAIMSGYFGGVTKLTDYVSTPMTLPCIKDGCKKTCTNPDHSYELYSVVTHTGISLSSGHYVAYVRAPPTGFFPYQDIPSGPKPDMRPITCNNSFSNHQWFQDDPMDGLADPNNNADTNNNLDVQSIPACPSHVAGNQLITRNDEGALWLECDDESVTVLTQSELEESLSPSSNSSPYLLFYHKRGLNWIAF